MLAFKIEDADIKDFMDKLFRGNSFDGLEVRSIELETIVRYEINGGINKQYLKDNEERYFAKWSELKGIIFQLIKGKKKPKLMKIIFSLDENAVKNIDPNAAAAFLNISYENNAIMGTTGTSQKNFSLDKSFDIKWEDIIKKFFKKNNIFIKEL